MFIYVNGKKFAYYTDLIGFTHICELAGRPYADTIIYDKRDSDDVGMLSKNETITVYPEMRFKVFSTTNA